jgi:methyltransferase-like protein
LLCHKNAEIKRRVAEDFFDDLQIVCDLKSESDAPDFSPQKIEKFVKPGKEGVTIDHPLTKAALFYLCDIFPRSVSFSELVETSEQMVKKQLGEDFEFTETDREILKDIMLKIFGSELVNFFLYEPQVADRAGEKPETDKFVRWQANNSDTLFTRRHRTKKIEDDFVRNLITLCDGKHTREDIVRDYTEKISDGHLTFDSADENAKQQFIENLPQAVENQLQQAAKLGLFIS